MEARSITPAQAEHLKERVLPMFQFLERLVVRLDERGISPTAPISRSARKAYDAIHELSVHLHYRSCNMEAGTGYPQPIAPRLDLKE